MPLDRRGGSELFYVDESGRRRDAELHEEILSQGDHGPGLEVSTKIRESMLARARRYLPAEPVNKPPAKDAWNPLQPREPAGTSEGGQFASITGGGISGGATGGPAKPATKKLFEASTSHAHHKQRVAETLDKAALRNDNYRYKVGKLIDEAKEYGSDAVTIAGLKTKIGESFYQQGLVKKEKGQDTFGKSTLPLALSMIEKGKSYGYVPTAEDIAKEQAPAPEPKPAPVEAKTTSPTKTYTQQISEAEQALKSELEQGGSVSGFEYGHPAEAELLVQAHGSLAAAGAMWSPKSTSTASIPVITAEWTKIGPQKGSVAGGMYGDPNGNTFYVKTPKTEDHVHADLLSNALYKMAGASVSNEVKTVLEGKSAVASKFIPGMATLADLDSSAQGYARKALREDFAVDAWLGNRDVIGEGFDNVIASKDGQMIVRLDQGGTLMYRAQGETKPFGPAVDEITSMRSTNINPQTASVFGIMTDQEVSASIDKVLAIPDSHIVNATKAHGMTASLAATLIARKQWLAEYQKTLDVPGKSPAPKEEHPAWMEKLQQQKAAAQPKPSAAELEKAKKVGPYYPAPSSPMGQAAVKAFNEKWATKTPEAHELEQKVAEYKATKAAVTLAEEQEQEAQHKAAVEEQKTAAAKAKAAAAAAKAKVEAEAAKHKEAIAKIAADIGLSPHDAEQVDALVELAGGDQAKIVAQFKSYYDKDGVGKHGLPVTPFESAMIQMYVGPHAYENNAKLRSGVWDTKTHVFAKGIQTALAKLPAYNGVVQRGFTAKTEEQQKYQPGKIVLWQAFSSCGKSGSFGGNVQCVITPLPGKNSRARDLGSFNPTETGGEVLFMANSSFKVSKVQGSPGGNMKVWLDEVEPL